MSQVSRMPALFAGHDIDCRSTDAALWQGWLQTAARFPQPRAIVCVSAQWQTQGICISVAGRQHGELPYRESSRVAQLIAGLLDLPSARLDSNHPLDEAVVSLVQALYPQSDIPLVQISLDTALSPLEHAALGAWLRPLREQGILIVGIGSIAQAATDVHAMRFRARVGEMAGHGNIAQLAESTVMDHDQQVAFLPLLYTLALRAADDSVQLFDDMQHGRNVTSVLLQPTPLARC